MTNRGSRQPRIVSGGARVVLAVMTLAAIASCGGEDAAPTTTVSASASGDVAPGLVTPAQAADLAADGVTVIDVRTPEEYSEGHLSGSTLIDFYGDDFAETIAALPNDKEYLLYCRSGNRSGQTFALMQELGFDVVYDMDGGMIAYTAEGLPLAP